MSFNEKELERYADPISNSEKEQCKNAISMVKDALVKNGYTLNGGLSSSYESDSVYSYTYELRDGSSNLTIVLQGSYANNTNIRSTSDVDVSIVSRSIFEQNINQFSSFKYKIYKALNDYFINSKVDYKNKSINIEGNSYRKSIDVVPAYSIKYNLEDGIMFKASDGSIIYNYPIKQIKNEIQKNKETGYKYKKYVRIFKNIKRFMIFQYPSAKEIGSFQIESLLWNVPNDYFKSGLFGYGCEQIINYLYSHKYLLSTYIESNGIKKLCPNHSDVTKMDNFITDLKKYFQYDWRS